MSESTEHEIRTLRAHFWSDRDPDGRAFAPLAEAYLSGGNVEEALALVEDGLGRLPDYATGHLVAARVHRARGDVGAARSAVEALLALDRGNAPGLRLLGELSEEAGETHAAVEAFRQAFERDPGYADLEGRIARLAYPTPEKGPEGGARSNPEEVESEPVDLPEADLGEAEGPQSEVGDPDSDPDTPGSTEPASAESVGSGFGIQDLESEAVADDLSSDDLAFHTFEEFEKEVRQGESAASHETEPESVPEDLRSEGMSQLEEASKGRTEPSPPLITRTMAELFVRQGVIDRGIEVYRQLVERDPENTELQGRLANLESGGYSHPSETEAFGGPAVPPVDEGPLAEFPEPDTTERVETEGVKVIHEETGGGGGIEGQPTGAGYLRDLLAWEPGAVSIESLAPEKSEGGGQG